MDILELLPMSKERNQLAVCVKDRNDQSTNAISSPKSRVATVAQIFLKHWVATSGTPSKLRTDNSSQIMSDFLVSVYSTIGVNNVTNT